MAFIGKSNSHSFSKLIRDKMIQFMAKIWKFALITTIRRKKSELHEQSSWSTGFSQFLFFFLSEKIRNEIEIVLYLTSHTTTYVILFFFANSISSHILLHTHTYLKLKLKLCFFVHLSAIISMRAQLIDVH